MSNAAAKTVPSTLGTARSLTAPAEKAGAGRKARTPLSLVRSAPGKRRTPFVVLCFVAMAAALLTVLVLNISVSTAQYQLVQLKAEAATLNKENQDLTQKKQNYEAPQNLAAKAAELGMVASTTKGQIDLNTMAVTGKASPAVKGDNPGALLAAPAVEGLIDVVPSVTTKEPLESRKPEATPVAPAATPSTPAAPPAAAPPAELYGGSVPAPRQKVPGQ
ncbi:hypothetical protein [Paenarthrobacter aurescens]|uniref:Cell division protein FtsL n=1 Tax=Paenarthrobacter aurescens TaxID=43663 RepID=A0A4Y3NG26_PAEAU|nr:hypothetical protein [Paenarthrobacter aurescens]MDO6143222.1 hypothetical protein [Paenarthrobacter aurescens]MDO6147068.1 hypothetical protein [Paenarthrobacter aurescens]MDO6158314.1 hypothetical protein [Paenarthrobacter aurescens]MDO6162298.1 hypothetical protein [Paenarthrobacter aurescens]GEB20213.1 hypothetical protein AAU01_29680 [Paenarthrobacter aurescens]